MIISQGAEARVYKTDFYGKPAIEKVRFQKKYRHPTLDAKILSRQINQEVRLIHRCLLNDIPVPCIYNIDKHEYKICMEYIEGDKVKDVLLKHNGENDIEGLLALKMAEVLAKMHDNGIIHGDLTTSNMIMNFGLGFVSKIPEDKAVDLYVFERAMISTFPSSAKLLSMFFESYTKMSKHSASVMNRLADVRLRGRKRDMTG
ncbi:hypothetical protein BB559_002230 [Furculomyces boomerangus]|uniref:non-specific serine/threonine protein kinase n=1 Tax=Furculomyces boomerangus TaxID=61424 RepID=A0A2T9YWZ5_9FUNG|nr:hypothetical protein BB559_002230 [Furculomyces boomerangus]